MRIHGWGILTVLFIILLLTAGCSETTSSNGASTGSHTTEHTEGHGEEENTSLTSLRVQLGWFPEAQYGGEYAAYSQGFFEEEGLQVEIKPGGPQVSGLQIVAVGDVEIGLAKADGILLARKEGLPVVAIAGVMQNSPQALIYHAGQDIQSFEDVAGRTVFFVPGVPAYEYAKLKYGLDDLYLDEQISDGSLVRFLNDEHSLLHGFAVSEPAILEEHGIEADFLLFSELGYNPYEMVVFTTESFLEEHPETVRAYLRSLKKGWEFYRQNYEEVNQVIHKANPELTVEVLNRQAQDQEEFIFGGDTVQEGFGVMKAERWEKTKEQLIELGDLTDEVDVHAAFTTEYLEGDE